MGCTAEFIPVQGNCSVLPSCITHTKPIKILLLAASPLEAQLFSTEALQTRLFLLQGLWEAKWAALGTDGTMPYKMASCTETWKAHSPLTAFPQALLISCLRLKNVRLPNRKNIDKTNNLFLNLRRDYGKISVWIDKQNYHTSSHHLSPGTHMDNWLQTV